MKKFFTLRGWVRALYALQGTGLPRMAEFIRKTQAKRHPNTEIVIEDFCGGAKFICRLGEHMGSQIYWRGSYSGPQLKVLASRLRPGGVFIDLGANQREFSVCAARLVGERGRVYAFEPSPVMQRRLRSNVSLNGFVQVCIEAVAVADKPGRLTLFSATGIFGDGTTHDGLPTLYERGDEVATSTVEVPVTTLDEWQTPRNIEHVDVIKMDIEGAELPALKGGLRLIQRFRPVLFIELNAATSRAAGYSMQDLVAWLHEQDYELQRIDDDGCFLPLELDRLQPFQDILATPCP